MVLETKKNSSLKPKIWIKNQLGGLLRKPFFYFSSLSRLYRVCWQLVMSQFWPQLWQMTVLSKSWLSSKLILREAVKKIFSGCESYIFWNEANCLATFCSERSIFTLRYFYLWPADSVSHSLNSKFNFILKKVCRMKMQ